MVGMPALSRAVAEGSANIEGLLQIGEFALALLLSAIIGLEREFRQKQAGLRTQTLVGAGAALFMLISKYGFNDVLEPGRIVVDPSRVAAQIVTGVGFLGAGLIFVRQDAVRGLTTAAAVWVTAAIGAAAGAGLPVLACVATAAYLLVALAFPLLTRRLPTSGTAISRLLVRYPDGRGVLREILSMTTARGFAVDQLSAEALAHPAGGLTGEPGGALVEVQLHVHGRGSVNELAAALAELPDVHAVVADDVNAAQPD
jgi:putative Mg2+ transporter-C (MgtC) family protein